MSGINDIALRVYCAIYLSMIHACAIRTGSCCNQSPRSYCSRSFRKVGRTKPNSAHYFSQCKRCLGAHYLRAAVRKLQTPDLVEPRSPLSRAMVGRQKNFESHLENANDILDTAIVPAPLPQNKTDHTIPPPPAPHPSACYAVSAT